MAANYSAKFSIGGIPEFEGAAKNAQQSLDQILSKWQQVAAEAEKARNTATRSGDLVAANQFDQQRLEAVKKSNAAIAAAYKELKITPQAVDNSAIQKQIAAYKAIRDSGVASYQDIEKARLKAERAINNPRFQPARDRTEPNFAPQAAAAAKRDDCDPCKSADKVVRAINDLGNKFDKNFQINSADLRSLGDRIDRSVNGTILSNLFKGASDLAITPIKALMGGLNNLLTGIAYEAARPVGAGVGKSINSLSNSLGGTENIGKVITNEVIKNVLGSVTAIPAIVNRSDLSPIAKELINGILKRITTELKSELQNAKQGFIEAAGGQTAVDVAAYSEQEKEDFSSQEAKDLALENATKRRRQFLRALPSVKQETQRLQRIRQELEKGSEGVFKDFSIEEQQSAMDETLRRLEEIKDFYGQARKDLDLIKKLTPNYNLPQAYLETVKKLSKQVGEEFKLENVPDLRVNENLQSGDALYSLEANQIQVPADLYERLINNESTPDDIQAIAHEYRHGYQGRFGSVRGLTNEANNISDIDYLKPTAQELREQQDRINKSVGFSSARSSEEEAYIRNVETDAYSFQKIGNQIYEETVKPLQLQAAKDSISESKVNSFGTDFIAEYRKIVAEAEAMGIEISKELDIVYSNFVKQFKQLDELTKIANNFDGSETSEQLVGFKNQAGQILNRVSDESADSIGLLQNLLQAKKSQPIEERAKVQIPFVVSDLERELVEIQKPLEKFEPTSSQVEKVSNIPKVFNSEGAIAINRNLSQQYAAFKAALKKGDAELAKTLGNKIIKDSEEAYKYIEGMIASGQSDVGIKGNLNKRINLVNRQLSQLPMGDEKAAFGINTAKQAVADARAIVEEFIQAEGKLRKVGAALASDKANEILGFGLNVGIGAIGATPSAYDKAHPAMSLMDAAASMFDTTGSVVTNNSDEAIAQHAVMLKKIYIDPLLRGETTLEEFIKQLRGQNASTDPLIAELEGLEGTSLARFGDVNVEVELFYKKIISYLQGMGDVPDEVIEAIRQAGVNEDFGINPRQKAQEAVEVGNAANREAQQAESNINRSLGNFGDIEELINSGKTQFEWVDEAKAKFRGLRGQIVDTGLSILSAFGVYSVSDVLVQFNQQIFQTTARFEQLDNTIKFSSGSSIAAAKNIRFLNDEISRLNLDKTVAFQQYGQLLGGTQGTTLEGDAGNRIFSAVSQAGVVQGLSSEQQQRALVAITQMIGKGRVTAEELRGQLGEALPSAFSTFAQALGVTTQQLNAMLERGELGIDELQKFAAQLKSNTDSGVAGAADLATNKLTKFNNALTEVQIKAGEGILPLQKMGLDVASNGLNLLADSVGFLQSLLVAGTIAAMGFLVQIGKFIITLPIVKALLNGVGASLSANIGAIAKFGGQIALLTIGYQIFSDAIKASSDSTTKEIEGMVDNSANALKRFRGELQTTQEMTEGKSWFENSSDFLVGGVNSITGGNTLATFDEARNNQRIIAITRALDVYNDFASKPLFDVEATQTEIDRITAKIQQLEAVEISTGDREGRERNTKEIQALMAERDKLNQRFADQNAIIQSQIDAFTKIREDLIKNAVTPLGVSLKNQWLPLIDNAIAGLNKTESSLGKLMNRVSNSLSEVTKNVRDLNEAYSAFNDNLDRQAIAFELNQANQNTGTNLSIPSSSATIMQSGYKGIEDFPFTSPYGDRIHPITGKKTFHQGVDHSMPVGTPISFATRSKVVDVGSEAGYGNFVEIQTENGLKVFFAHLSEVMVKKGDQLLENQLIAKSGNTGRSTGAHLHTEIRNQGGVLVNPTSRMDVLNQIRFGGKATAATGGRNNALEMLKEEIASGEGGYNSFNRGRAGDSPERAKEAFGKNLTQFTIAEILKKQQSGDLFAVGKYQFIPNTLKEAVNYTGIKGNELFNEKNQERLFNYLISDQKRPRLAAFLSGRSKNSDAAINDLAQEFASIPNTTGRGEYDGDSAGNLATGGLKRVERIRGILNAIANSRNSVPQIANIMPSSGDPVRDFLNRLANSANPIGSVPKSAETLQGDRTLFDLKQGQQKIIEAQRVFAGASSALNAPNVLENARSANVIGANGEFNQASITRLIADQGTKPETKQSLEIIQQFIDARNNLEKVTAEFSQRNLAYAQQIKGLNYQAEDAKRKAANDDANQKFQANINLITASFDLRIAQTLDENKRKLLESEKQLTLTPLNQGLKLQQENQKLLDLEIARIRQNKDGNPFGIDTKALDQQIATQKELIKNLEKESGLVSQKLTIEDQNLKREIAISLETERQNQSGQLRLEILKAQGDELVRNLNRDLRDNTTTDNSEQVQVQIRAEQELNRIKAERLQIELEIFNAQLAYNEAVRKGTDAALTDILKQRLEFLQNKLPELDRQVSDVFIDRVVGQDRANFNRFTQSLSTQSELANTGGELASLRAARLDRNNDPFGGNALRRASEAAKLRAELQSQLAPLDRLLSNPVELKESGKTREEVQQLKAQLIEINQLKLENIQNEFADLGTAIAQSADRAASTFFDNITDWITNVTSLGDALRQFAITVIKSLGQIAGQGILGGIKNLFGLGGTDNGGFTPLFSGLFGGGGGGGGLIGSLFGGGGGLFSSLFAGPAPAVSSFSFAPVGSILGFSEGGFTGEGDRLKPAGIVHKGEMVFSQKDVSAIGLNVLNNIRSTGRLPIPNIRSSSSNGEGRSQQTSNQSINVTNVFSGNLQDSFRRSSAQVANTQAEAMRRAARYGRQ